MATRRASQRSSSEQHRPLSRQSCIERPTISSPRSFNNAAVADESTPPLMATAIMVVSKSLQSFLNRVGGQDAAMDLGRGQSAKRFRDLIFCNAAGLRDVHADDHFRGVGGCRDRCTAALGLESRVLDSALLDLNPEFHHVAANRIRHLCYGVSIGEFSHASGVL